MNASDEVALGLQWLVGGLSGGFGQCAELGLLGWGAGGDGEVLQMLSEHAPVTAADVD